VTIGDFNKDFTERINDARPLDLEDFRGLLEWFKQSGPVVHQILDVRLAIDHLQALSALTQAIAKFDRTSTKLNKWLIALTVTLVALTIVITVFTVLLWRRAS
jgi:hypothetical protein